MGLKFDFFFNFYFKEPSIHCTIQPSRIVFRGVVECQLRKLFVNQEMGYKSKNIIAAVNFFSVEVDLTFFKGHAKNLVKVTRIGEVMDRKIPSTLRKLSFKFRH